MTTGRHLIVRSYRDLYRHGLYAVQYASPARYTLRTLLQNAFRNNPATAYNEQRIANTILFLKLAAKERGFEHRLLKNLLHVWWWQLSVQRHRKEYFHFTAIG